MRPPVIFRLELGHQGLSMLRARQGRHHEGVSTGPQAYQPGTRTRRFAYLGSHFAWPLRSWPPHGPRSGGRHPKHMSLPPPRRQPSARAVKQASFTRRLHPGNGRSCRPGRAASSSGWTDDGRRHLERRRPEAETSQTQA
eukprot:scaffold68780_cov76-Phaeocystis_antarctica.AAC.2